MKITKGENTFMKIKNEFKIYLLVWVVAIVVFHILLFNVKRAISENELLTSRELFNIATSESEEYLKTISVNFVLSYVFILLSFISQLVCSFVFLNQKDNKNVIYHYPIFAISLQGLVITIIFAIVFVFFAIPSSISCIALIIIFAVTLSRCVLAKGAAEKVMANEKNINIKTQYIKVLTNEIQSMLLKVKNNDEKKIVSELYDKVRFSDPMSTIDVKETEEKIIAEIEDLHSYFGAGIDELKAKVKKVLDLVDEKNSILKMNK